MENLKIILYSAWNLMKKDFMLFGFNISFSSLMIYSVVGFLILVIVFKILKS